MDTVINELDEGVAVAVDLIQVFLSGSCKLRAFRCFF
jgi:hypothetical protein